MKVALIHDHLAQDGGAEKVLKVLAELYPTAPIYTLLYEKDNANKYFRGRQILTSVIQRLPGGVKHYKWYMPFMPMAVEFFDLSEFDLILSDASAFAKGVITPTDSLHICYCHTPTRYLWSDSHSYIKELPYNKYLKKIIAFVLNYIRVWDRVAADRVDLFIANSRFIKKRIAKYYRRPAEVIYPPVDVKRFQISSDVKDYYLIGGRLVPYKRFDIVIEAFKELNLPLKIFGEGIDLARLKKIAIGHSNIEFVGRVDDQTQAQLYSQCQAFINPQEEDFGITAVEAMASGRPVIAYAQGGVLEQVIADQTGVFFSDQTKESLIEAVKHCQAINFDPQFIKHRADQFSAERFKQEIADYINKKYYEFKH
ncbi:MAG: Glycosyl transferase group 1 [Candidatus Falkowbacteria bacterium GW2011_GWA2_39_24]|uniref:Glycosyl transferase group 1 n=1 Tax=Candidatus Falkowbacteria bacterium GW2011_GWA2_39_24 TaxID=1618634 RepID=A0A0G0NFJ4_9BACT|nr:MAG: Glycosyl transferase group 1 [Candidatus Falkowbacteria bacterium GW2011_GWA2_39_24]